MQFCYTFHEGGMKGGGGGGGVETGSYLYTVREDVAWCSRMYVKGSGLYYGNA